MEAGKSWSPLFLPRLPHTVSRGSPGDISRGRYYSKATSSSIGPDVCALDGDARLLGRSRVNKGLWLPLPSQQLQALLAKSIPPGVASPSVSGSWTAYAASSSSG